MKKIVITLTAEQKVEMAKKLGIINDELIIMVPEEGEKNRDIFILKKNRFAVPDHGIVRYKPSFCNASDLTIEPFSVNGEPFHIRNIVCPVRKKR